MNKRSFIKRGALWVSIASLVLIPGNSFTQSLIATRSPAFKAASSGAAAPTYSSADGAASYTVTGGTSTITVTVGTTIAAGKHAVIVWTIRSASLLFSSATDSTGGNTWALREERQWATYDTFIISAHVTSQLTAGATITITLSGSPGADMGTLGQLFVVNNVNSATPEDVSAKNGSFGTTVTASATTATASTEIVGIVIEDGQTETYGSSNFTMIGSNHDAHALRAYYYHSTKSSINTYDLGGAWNANTTWAAVWTAFK